MSNKTISINPSLFSLSKTKTKKNREKKSAPKMTPLISPSVLKNKLLKRIKEHKTKETQNLENNRRKLGGNQQSVPIKTNNDQPSFTDEFADSINYLQTLTKQKRIDEEKINNELLKQKRKEELERKTIRNYHSISGESPIQNPTINIDLPEELMQPVIKEPIGGEPFQIHAKDDLPYSIMKGGKKPTYREWSRTQRNNIVTNPNASLIIQGGNLSSEKTARENRLNLLKQKIKNKESVPDPMMSQNLIKPQITQQPSLLQQPSIQQPSIQQPSIQQPSIQQPSIVQQFAQQLPLQQQPQIAQQPQQNGSGKIIATKHITKKTIKRKYTLGRSKIKKSVSVLIKDRGTRKKVLNAQKDLKRKNINDIKIYLREHNLIKTGSNAPNDVLRKLYESAMLSGEITNSNPDTLLHNFAKDDKEL